MDPKGEGAQPNLRQASPMGSLSFQPGHLIGQSVDLLLGPDDVVEVHLVALETLMRPRGVGQEGGGRGGATEGQDGRFGRGMGGVPQLLHLLLQDPLPRFQVTDLHLWGNIFWGRYQDELF